MLFLVLLSLFTSLISLFAHLGFNISRPLSNRTIRVRTTQLYSFGRQSVCSSKPHELYLFSQSLPLVETPLTASSYSQAQSTSLLFFYQSRSILLRFISLHQSIGFVERINVCQVFVLGCFFVPCYPYGYIWLPTCSLSCS